MLCFWTVVLDKTLENSLDSKEIKPVNPKGSQPWIFIGRTDAEAPILWSPDTKSQLFGKAPDAGKYWRQEENGGGDGWMASPTQWTWVWVSSGRWWRTGEPGGLQSMGSQRVGHDWGTGQWQQGLSTLTLDSYLESSQRSSVAPVGKESMNLIAGWEFTECSARAAGKKKEPEKNFFCESRQCWAENFALWVVWICWESPDFWWKTFILFSFAVSTISSPWIYRRAHSHELWCELW